MRRDSHHAIGRRILSAAETGRIGMLEVNEYVLAETMNFLVRRASLGAAKQTLANLKDSPGIKLSRVSTMSYHKARDELFPTSTGPSFVDCITLAHMQECGLKTIYSFDRDFDGQKPIKRLFDVAR